MKFILVGKKKKKNRKTKYLRGPVAIIPGFTVGLPLSGQVSSGKLHCRFGLPFFLCKIKKLNCMIYCLFQRQSLSLRYFARNAQFGRRSKDFRTGRNLTLLLIGTFQGCEEKKSTSLRNTDQQIFFLHDETGLAGSPVIFLTELKIL